MPMIHVVRHGESLHNVDHSYPHRDPPLTEKGQDATTQIKVHPIPNLIVISPMTRTIQTAINAFPSILSPTSVFPVQPEVQIWPDLREAHDANCNKGLSRIDISAKFPQLDFKECPGEWNHPPHTIEDAVRRAEGVRRRLKELSQRYPNIAVITHRVFIAFLVRGRRFDVCETRSYQFSTADGEEEDDDDNKSNNGAELGSSRMDINVDTAEMQDFGPTILIPNRN